VWRRWVALLCCTIRLSVPRLQALSVSLPTIAHKAAEWCTFSVVIGACVQVGGWFGIVTAAVAIYIGFAELFNETAQRVRFAKLSCGGP
jgi:succinate-acetate transporter protein